MASAEIFILMMKIGQNVYFAIVWKIWWLKRLNFKMILIHIFISYVYASDISAIYIEYNLPENNIKYNWNILYVISIQK